MWKPLDSKQRIFKSNLNLPLEMRNKLYDIIVNNTGRENEKGSVDGSRLNTTLVYSKSFQLRKDDCEEWRSLFDDFHSRIQKMVSQQVDIQIHSSWAVVYDPESAIELHDHKPHDWTIVYYLQATEGAGEIQFPKQKVFVEPKTDMVLLADASLLHCVYPSSNPEAKRICIAMSAVTATP